MPLTRAQLGMGPAPGAIRARRGKSPAAVPFRITRQRTPFCRHQVSYGPKHDPPPPESGVDEEPGDALATKRRAPSRPDPAARARARVVVQRRHGRVARQRHPASFRPYRVLSPRGRVSLEQSRALRVNVVPPRSRPFGHQRCPQLHLHPISAVTGAPAHAIPALPCCRERDRSRPRIPRQARPAPRRIFAERAGVEPAGAPAIWHSCGVFVDCGVI